MKFLVIGKGGQLGDTFAQLLADRGHSFLQLGEDAADLAHPESLELPLAGIDCVLNCAAFTNVDGAETDEETARRVNGTAVGEIAAQCAAAGVPLVHFSTDYVFDGQAKRPYPPGEPRAPLGAYGRTKALGEELLESSGADFLLVRTSWVYAGTGRNFALTIAKLCQERDELKVVDDQRGRPTHALTLAERSLALFERGLRGTYHVTDEGECTWFGFACAIRDVIGSNCRILPCTTEEFPRPAPRPSYSVLDTTETDQLLGTAPHFKTRLLQMTAALKGS